MMKTQSGVVQAGLWMRRVRYVVTASLTLSLLLALSSTTARAAAPIVVGNGTPESCTLDALNQAIAAVPAGGTIIFNCGPDPVTIFIRDVEINKDLTIDGGGLVTFTGHNPFYIVSGTVQFIDFTVAQASGDTAGGIENYGTLTLHRVTLANNGGGHGYGGGGVINGGMLVIVESTIVGNAVGCDQAMDCGPAGGIWNKGTLRIVSSTISGNRASEDGGGIFNQGAATIENSTISGNWAGGNGGGIDNHGTLMLQNSTLANNTAQSGGGLANDSATNLQNSLLAGNTDSSNQPSDCSGTLTSLGYNLIGSAIGCTIGGNATGNLLGVEPLLGPLQDNGGPTLTHTLHPGSPAIDAGNPATPGSGGTACEATDQRGVTRPQDGNGDGLARCDIGAVEVKGSFLTVQIDIKPGDRTNPVNLKSAGVIPVAILSTSTFTAESVLPASVKFGPNGASAVRSSLEDVNGDGRLDLVLHFRTQQTGLQAGDTQACLAGQIRSGTPIQGCDRIQIVP